MNEKSLSNLPYFIGRDDELVAIEEARLQGKYIYTVKGTGGIGKTTLLKKYNKQLQGYQFPESNILFYDFDDYRYRTSCDVRVAIAEDIGNHHFSPYYEKRDYLQSLSSGASHEIKRRARRDIALAWKESIETFSENNHLVIMFDTLDSLSKDERDELVRFFFRHPIDNVFFLIAGRLREINQLHIEFKKFWDIKIIKRGVVNSKSLSVLSSSDSYKYFLKKCDDSGTDIPWDEDKTFSQIVYLLTRGVPILVDLFIEVSLSENGDDFIDLIKKEVNKNNIESKRIWFKKQLISHFSRSSEVNELVPFLSHVWPVNYHMLCELKDMGSENQAIDLLERASKSSFIKTLPDSISQLLDSDKKDDISIPDFMITLHDIMREIMNCYGWEDLEQDNEIRKQYSTKFLPLSKGVLSSIDKELNNKNEIIESDNDVIDDNETCGSSSRDNSIIKSNDKQLRLHLLEQDINKRKLKHTLFLNPEEGISLFIELFDNNYGKRKHEQAHYLKQLFTEINYYKAEQDEDIQGTNYLEKIDSEANLALAIDYLTREIRFWGGRDLKRADYAITDLKKRKLGWDSYIYLVDEIAEFTIRNGDFKKALEIVEEGIGHCTKMTSDKIKFVDKALYRQWFKLLTIKGWVFRLIGDIDKADAAYTEALVIPTRFQLNLGEDIPPREMAYLLNNMAYAKALLRQYDQSIVLTEEAEELFLNDDYRRGVGMVESTRGRIEIEFDHYLEAIRSFERALEYFARDDIEWRSKIFLGLAHALWLQGQFGKDLTSDQRDEIFRKAEREFRNAEEQDMPSDKAELYHLEANLALAEGNYDLGKENYLKCEAIASKMHALYYQARAIAGQMRLASLTNDLHSFSEIQEKFETFIKQHPEEKRDALSLALFNRYEGDLYLLAGNVDKAITNYKEALPIIARYGRYTPFNLKGQMHGMTQFFVRYINIDVDLKSRKKLKDHVKRIGKELLQFWLSEKDTQTNTLYSSLYAAALQVISKWSSGSPDKWDHD